MDLHAACNFCFNLVTALAVRFCRLSSMAEYCHSFLSDSSSMTLVLYGPPESA